MISPVTNSIKLYRTIAYVLCLTSRFELSLMIASGSEHIVLLLVQSAKLFILVQELRKLLTVFCPVLLEAFNGSRLTLEKLFAELLKRFDSVFVFFNHIVIFSNQSRREVYTAVLY